MEQIYVKHMMCEVADQGLLVIDNIGVGVGVLLYSAEHKVAAGMHIMAARSDKPAPPNPSQYANTAIPHALRQLGLKGIKPPLSVAIAGGAKMLDVPECADIGQVIVRAVKDAFSLAGLAIKLDKTFGEPKIRTMSLYVEAGKIKII